MSHAREDGSPRDRALLAAWDTAERLVPRLPASLVHALARTGADLAWHRRGAGVRQLERTLARARPRAGADELADLSRRGMRSYATYWVDLLRLPHEGPEHRAARVVVTGREHLDAGLAQGRGVVVPLPHAASFEHAGSWATRVAPVTTVAERLRPEGMFRRHVALRAAVGIEVLALTGDGDVTGVLAQRLRANGIVALLADRDLTGRGVAVQLLAAGTSVPPGPALLALRTGAALVPASLHYLGRPPHHRLALRFHPAVPVPTHGRVRERVATAAQGAADALSEGLRAHPEDWHVLQPLFCADRPGAGA